jgi:hypothetical protein
MQVRYRKSVLNNRGSLTDRQRKRIGIEIGIGIRIGIGIGIGIGIEANGRKLRKVAICYSQGRTQKYR